MKDKSFESAMNKIAAQAAAEQQNEVRAAKRAHLMGRIKGGVIFLVIGAAAVTGMCYHKELQETIAAKISPAKTVAAATDANSADTNNLVIAPGLKGMTQAPNKVSASLVTAQANAQLRDSIIDQMGK